MTCKVLVANMETICSGWLTKSPPGKFVDILKRGRFHVTQKLIKAKWRRRYFVLYKPDSSLPGAYALEYYEDDSLHHRRGSICLEECDQIDSSLESSFYQHLFSLHTKDRSRPRNYYLAADSEADMTKWVHCLRNVCRINNGPPAATPAVGGILSEGSSGDGVDPDSCGFPPPLPIRFDSMTIAMGNAIMLEIEGAATNSAAAQPESFPAENIEAVDSYIPLDECIAGETRERRNSLPVTPAPLPPSHLDSDVSCRDSCDPEVYDIPPLREGTSKGRNSADVESLYQVPPVRSPSDAVSKKPPRRIGSGAPGSSASLYGNSASSGALVKNQQWSLAHCDLADENRSSTTSDVYDVPPPPARPPKPHITSLNATGDQTQDEALSEANDTDQPVRTAVDADDIYDFPRTVATTVDPRLLSSPPPSCDGGTLSVHKYINAGLAMVPNSGKRPWSNEELSDGQTRNDLYVVPPSAKAVGVNSCMLPLAVAVEEDTEEMVHQYPKGQQPHASGAHAANTYPARPFKPKQLRESAAGEPVHIEGSLVHNGQVFVPLSGQNATSLHEGSVIPLENESIALPRKVGSGSNDADTSSDDDASSLTNSDDEDNDSAEASPLYQTPRRMLSYTSSVPPPRPVLQPLVSLSTTADKALADRRPLLQQQHIEYLDLDHDTDAEASGHSPQPSRSASFGNQAPLIAATASFETEYTAIDKVKTKALESTMKARDLQTRKGSENKEC